MRRQLSFIGNNGLDAVRADAQFCVEHGFEGLEFNYWANFEQLERSTVEATKAILDEYAVTCVMFGIWGWNHLAPDAEERAKSHAMLQKAIEFGEILEADILTTGGGTNGDDLDANVAEFAAVFPPFLTEIASRGMVPSFYPLHGNSFFTSIEAYEKVWETFPEVGIKFDPANWRNHGDDYLDVLRRYGNKVTHLHIKEHLCHGGELVSQPAAGMGDIEWGKVFAFLYEHDYSGPISIEPHGPIWSRGEMRERMLLLTQRHISQFLI
ncbi:MAG: sugar phosphate isomerase/epimerase [Lentisphaerae bacterium]|jgi:sugar phosphate isomerase/epimerase|nr:sugar phosphate isomerase/epimerase [Lentisphaerota bacterium]MBT4822594.1 sugar phosphate isomerase/epimerase [Lentisphaerota bacterium]MBT5610914.1 sugar phosphate isomerase/epimerase [Lentisphaerota bacterium]MBT7055911.1 sugar phosphate isomerase/epimerase [Lentisphaerota bacterium]MBT7846694.1 sugar phosphate isomerase/epimerase [Lentisphaerota bacterium]